MFEMWKVSTFIVVTTSQMIEGEKNCDYVGSTILLHKKDPTLVLFDTSV